MSFETEVKGFVNVGVVKSIAKLSAFVLYIIWMFAGTMFWLTTTFKIFGPPYDYYMVIWEKMWVIPQ